MTIRVTIRYVNESLKQRDYLISAEEKGREEGIEKGIEKGREEGIKEKAIAMAKKMLAKRKPIDEIIEFTELTLEEINKLREE